jgi:hypothetical protein
VRLRMSAAMPVSWAALAETSSLLFSSAPRVAIL